MAISECPVDKCEDCEHYRIESWCAQAIPDRPPLSDLYKSYMEGFWDALDWCEEHYKELEFILEEIDQKIVDGIYVEVTHCKDCIYYEGHNEYCYNDMFAKEDGYCHHGKPKEKQ